MVGRWLVDKRQAFQFTRTEQSRFRTGGGTMAGSGAFNGGAGWRRRDRRGLRSHCGRFM